LPGVGGARLPPGGRVPQLDGPGLADQAPAVGRYRDTGSTLAIFLLKSAFGSLADKTFDKPYPYRSKALFMPEISLS
jgi:hypothetical protein